MGILKSMEKIKEDTDKLQEMLNYGPDEYEKTHSNCCDAKIMMGICMACKEHTVSQLEVDEDPVAENYRQQMGKLTGEWNHKIK